LRDVDSVGGGVENEGFPLTKPVAVNTGLRNCAACDATYDVETSVEFFNFQC